MNKQEAIETIKNIDTLSINDMITNQKIDMVIKNQVLGIISQIDEPQKVIVPKFVAELIEYCKQYSLDLQDLLSRLKDGGEMIPERVDMMARAWLDGYEVETEEEIDE